MGVVERKVMKWRRLSNSVAIFLDTKPIADAMASWRTPWALSGECGWWGGHGEHHAPSGERHTLHTSNFFFFFKVGGALWVPRHGAHHGDRHWCIFYTSSLFLAIFTMFSLVLTSTCKVPEIDTTCQHNTIKREQNGLKWRAYRVENMIHFMVISMSITCQRV